MKKITAWSVIDKDGSSKHNHIEDGWKRGKYPEPIKEGYSNQKAWKNLKWFYQHGYLLDNNKLDLYVWK